MQHNWVIFCGAVFALLALGGDAPSPWAAPPDFKIEVGEFALSSKPVTSAQLIVRDGRAYQFTTGVDEVIVIDPKRSRVELVDIARKVQAVITFAQLSESRTKLKAALVATVEKREKQGGRSNIELARITRDLIEPRFRVEGDPKTGPIRLLNPTVEIDASAEADPDASRLAMLAVTLDTIADLGAFRDPADLPPFSELAAISTVARDHHLRPTEFNYLYRLAGPPKRFRRTYRLVPSLTDREREAISRMETLREKATVVRYEKYVRTDRPRLPSPPPVR